MTFIIIVCNFYQYVNSYCYCVIVLCSCTISNFENHNYNSTSTHERTRNGVKKSAAPLLTILGIRITSRRGI